MDGCGTGKITRQQAKALWDLAEAQKTARAEAMPSVDDALRVMTGAYLRLKELGFREAMYCPKDGTIFECIEAGSSGVHDCLYEGEWPNGHYWIPDECDLWPSRPVLFRLKPPPEEKA